MSIIKRQFQYTYSNACIALIIANCVAFALCYLMPNIKIYFALCPALVIEKKYLWQFVTYMFMHGSLMHLLSNMIGLMFFGITTERALGSKEFLLLYFLCGVISGLLSFLYYIIKNQYIVFLIGASGALYSILFAYAVVFPRAKVFIWGVIPLPSPLLVVIYALIELFSQFSGKGANVAHYTHLFGFLAAYVYFIVRLGVNPIKVWRDAYR